MEFNSDQLFDGQRIRTLTIVVAFGRLLPAIDICQSYRGLDVVVTLEKVDRVQYMCRNIREPTAGPS